jgi:hypothetical protein
MSSISFAHSRSRSPVTRGTCRLPIAMSDATSGITAGWPAIRAPDRCALRVRQRTSWTPAHANKAARVIHLPGWLLVKRTGAVGSSRRMPLRTPSSAGSESRGDNFSDSRGDNRQECKSRSNNLFGRQCAAGAELGPAGFTASGTFVARSLLAISSSSSPYHRRPSSPRERPYAHRSARALHF